MIPLRVTLSGFLSYRDEVTFDFTDRTLWMLSGDNGAGKSSVFDAITFTLYKEHRGGKQGAGDLINKHCDRFKVSFEFQVGQERYRAMRTVTRVGAATRLLSHWDGVSWQPMPESDNDDGFKTCVAEIVGMNCETFTSSVLLRQGQGDKFLDPKTDRFALLSEIVDLSRYEELYRKAEAEQGKFKILARAAADKLKTLSEVTEEQIAEADRVITEAQQAANDAQVRWTVLRDLVKDAEQWQRLTKNVQSLHAKIDDADKLIANRDKVIADAERYGELKSIIPLLRSVHGARGNYREAEGKDREARASLDALVVAYAPRYAPLDPALTPEQQAHWLEQQITAELATLQGAKDALPYLETLAEKRDYALTVLDTIMRLQDEVQSSPKLPVTVEDACSGERQFRDAAQAAVDKARRQHAHAVSESIAVAERLERLEGAKQGSATTAECFYCEQPLSETQYQNLHVRLTGEKASCTSLEREKATEVSRHEETLRKAEEALQTARQSYLDSREAAHRLITEIAENQKLLGLARQDAQKAVAGIREGTYHEAAHQLFADPDTHSWPTRTSFPSAAELDDAKRKSAALAVRSGNAKLLENARTQATITTAALHTQAAAVAFAEKNISTDWLHWYDDQPTDANPVQSLQGEYVALADALEKRTRLDDATRDRDRWQEELTRDETEIEGIPKEARRPKTSVEADAATAEVAWGQANKTLDAAKGAAGVLKDQRNRYRETQTALIVNRRQQELYQTLADLLGPTNLQRSLLRGAEDAITDYANTALSAFSHGSLRLQPKADGEGRGGKDSTLDLVCVNTDAAEGSALPLSNLSGSQRFRVAVALALGIGRFASRNDALIESVIIDEGFGSLDRQNRHDIADAIRSLADDQSLKRIIVVSHDEVFADRFTDRIHVALGPNGSQIIERPMPL